MLQKIVSKLLRKVENLYNSLKFIKNYEIRCY